MSKEPPELPRIGRWGVLLPSERKHASGPRDFGVQFRSSHVHGGGSMMWPQKLAPGPRLFLMAG